MNILVGHQGLNVNESRRRAAARGTPASRTGPCVAEKGRVGKYRSESAKCVEESSLQGVGDANLARDRDGKNVSNRRRLEKGGNEGPQQNGKGKAIMFQKLAGPLARERRSSQKRRTKGAGARGTREEERTGGGFPSLKERRRAENMKRKSRLPEHSGISRKLKEGKPQLPTRGGPRREIKLLENETWANSQLQKIKKKKPFWKGQGGNRASEHEGELPTRGMGG